jgi:hypothetical protein
VRAPSDHVCPLCETTCDEVTHLRGYVRILQRSLLELAGALQEERAFWGMAFAELEAHLNEERAA